MRIIKVLGFFSAIIAFFFFFDLGNFIHNFSKANKSYLIWAFILTILSPLLPSLRLFLIIKLGNLKITYLTCIHAVLCGAALNLFLPARGGDIAKIGYLRSDKKTPWGILTGIVMMERVLDVLALSIIGFISSVYLANKMAAICCIGAATVASFGLISLQKLATIPLISKKCENLKKVSKQICLKKRKLTECFLTCCFSWTTNITIVGLLLQAFDDSISFTYSFSVTPPSILAGIIPVSLWGVGTRDGALAYFLEGSVSAENVISAGILYTALVYWFLGLLGTPLLLISQKSTRRLTN